MKAVLFGFSLLLATACRPRTDEVVVYTSVDDLYAREIFAAFTRETGIRVLPVFDTEEAKTLGLVHRILAEKAKPQCDVFWSGECARTVLLKKQVVIVYEADERFGGLGDYGKLVKTATLRYPEFSEFLFEALRTAHPERVGAALREVRAPL